MSICGRPAVLAAAFLVCTSVVAGCAYDSTETAATPTEPSTSSTMALQQPQREYTYPNGRYELRGSGSAGNPYYWVWIPAGVQTEPAPPPVPPLPPRS